MLPGCSAFDTYGLFESLRAVGGLEVRLSDLLSAQRILGPVSAVRPER